jgi:TolB-like protein/tetratricopeptide (TPR) repeat protein
LAEDRGVGLKGWLAGPRNKESRTETATVAALDRHRLAVLPFSNISPERQDEYFADGLTEELISTASAISGLTVIARTSVMRYKGAGKGAREIGRELNAGTLLEGSVRKSGSKLRVTVQLIDAQSEGHLWSESFDREMQDVFAVQTEIARQVASSLALRLTDKDKRIIDARRTVSMEAYNFYLKGRYFWNQRTKDGILKAIGFFEQAVKEDPRYALAFAGLSDAYGMMAMFGYAPGSETVARGKKYAVKALELDSALAEAHTSLAMQLLNEWDFEGYGRELRAALQVNPSYALAHIHYGDYLFLKEHDMERSMLEYLQGRDLDPFSPITNLNVCAGYYVRREYGKAISQLRRSLEVFPDFWNLHLYLSLSLAMDGQFEESLAEIESAGRSSDKVWVIQGRGTTYGLWGKTDQALKAIEELTILSQKEYVSPTMFAPIYAAMGDRDGAFKCFEKAFEERSSDLPGEIMGHPFYIDKLGTDPRWTKLLARLGLKPLMASQ